MNIVLVDITCALSFGWKHIAVAPTGIGHCVIVLIAGIYRVGAALIVDLAHPIL